MKRVLLKLSGEALAGDKKTGFDEATCMGVAKQVKQLVDDGVQVAIVTGGGNFWRGRTSETIDRVKADQIGMLATVMNCIYVSDIFRYGDTGSFRSACRCSRRGSGWSGGGFRCGGRDVCLAEYTWSGRPYCGCR